MVWFVVIGCCVALCVSVLLVFVCGWFDGLVCFVGLCVLSCSIVGCCAWFLRCFLCELWCIVFGCRFVVGCRFAFV